MSEESRIDPRESRDISDEETTSQIDDLLDDLLPGTQEEETRDESKEVIEEEKPAEEEEGVEEEDEQEVTPPEEEQAVERTPEEKTVEREEVVEPSDAVKAAMAEDKVETKALEKEAPGQDALIKMVDSLTGTVNDLKRQLAERPVETSKSDESAKAEEIDFLGDTDFGAILDTKEGLNKLLNQVLQKGVAIARESTTRAIPAIVQSQTQAQSAIRETVDQFYKDHKELLVARKTVGVVMNEVAAENTDWKFNKVLDETAKRVYGMLGIKKTIETKPDETAEEEEVKPSFAASSGSASRNAARKSKGKSSKLQNDIDNLIS